MNYKYLIAVLIIISAGCNRNGEKSDGYGNFEAETLIVSSESAGKIIQMNVEKGQKIDTGMMAVLIDTVQIHMKLQQIEAQKAAVESRRPSVQSQIAVYEEQKKNLKINEERISGMLGDGASTQKQLDDVKSQIAVIDKQISGIRTQFSSINSEIEVLDVQKISTIDLLNRCKVFSPASGTILETYIEKGELTTPGKPLFKMASLEDLTLKVYISGAQLSGFKIGQMVNVLIDSSEKENELLTGKITWISTEAEFTPKIIQTKEERVKLVYAVKIAVKNDGRLKIGMPGEMKALLSQQ